MVHSKTKHLLHCCLFFIVLFIAEIVFGGLPMLYNATPPDDPFERYGYVGTTLLYIIKVLPVLAIPQTVSNFLGLILYKAFPDNVTISSSLLFAPFICFRTVTRGDYPDLVVRNVRRNIRTCEAVGLEKFALEVVTEKQFPLPQLSRIRQVVVPPTYRTRSGALYKARALQYCLEDGVNQLENEDWIVHLDEETVLSENSVRGIVNFVMDGGHQFGQGLITYANEEVVNWLTTLADSYRVAEDMGKIRFQFHQFRKPIFSWKGSYVVSQVRAERDVSYDHGPDGSVAEDCFFSMVAFGRGYRFGFIEGEMWEKSPFTMWDFLLQRKRWMQGVYLVVHSSSIPVRVKFLLAVHFYAWMTVPLSTSNVILSSIFPVSLWQPLEFLNSFLIGVTVYMYIFGAIKSLNVRRYGFLKVSLYVLGAALTIPFNIIIENVAISWGAFGQKHQFYVVEKEITKRPVQTV